MKLLFDQNLSFKLCQTIADLFPDSSHARLLGLSEAADRVLWDFAKTNRFAIVSQDVDFAEMAGLFGAPPKVIWLRAGNQTTSAVSELLRRQRGDDPIFRQRRCRLSGNLLALSGFAAPTAACRSRRRARSG